MTKAKVHQNPRALEESVSSEEIDDLIDQWHVMPNPPCELHEWLGMSWEAYKECFGVNPTRTELSARPNVQGGTKTQK